MKLCLFASYTYKRKSIRVFRTPILVYLDVRGVEIPLLSTVSISNCRYQEAPGEVVWSDFLAQLPRRSIEILWHLTRPISLVKCQRITILLLSNCARISHTRYSSHFLAKCRIFQLKGENTNLHSLLLVEKKSKDFYQQSQGALIVLPTVSPKLFGPCRPMLSDIIWHE